MKFTNTRHPSLLVMYNYPNYCLLSSCPFSFAFITYILTETSTLQFCSFACFYYFPMAHHHYCVLLSIILCLLPLGLSFVYGCHIKHLIKVFICFVFLCNEIPIPGPEAYFQLHCFSQNNWPASMYLNYFKNHFFYRDLWMNFAKYGFRWRKSWIAHIRL